MPRGLLEVWGLHVVVLYREKTGRQIMECIREFFSPEKISIKGLGVLELYETKNRSIYFYSPKVSYEANTRSVERQIIDGVGRPNAVISINPHIADQREGIFLHTSGNIHFRDELNVGLSPCTLAPTDPNTFGSIVRAVYKFSKELGTPPNMHLEATHDLPADPSFPYLSFEVKGDYYELAALALVAGAGAKKEFEPYLGIGATYYGDEFLPLVKKGIAVPYYVPSYLAHNLTEELIEKAKEEGKIKGVIYGKGIRASGVF